MKLIYSKLLLLILCCLVVFNLSHLTICWANGNVAESNPQTKLKSIEFLVGLGQTRLKVGQSCSFYIFIGNHENKTINVKSIELNSDKIYKQLDEQKELPFESKESSMRLLGELKFMNEGDFDAVYITIQYLVNGAPHMEQVKMPSVKVERETFMTWAKGWEIPINIFVSIGTVLISFWYGTYSEKKKLTEACLREVKGSIINEIDSHLKQVADITRIESKLDTDAWYLLMKSGVLYVLPESERIKIKNMLNDYYKSVENYNTGDIHQRNKKAEEITQNGDYAKDYIDNIWFKRRLLGVLEQIYSKSFWKN